MASLVAQNPFDMQPKRAASRNVAPAVEPTAAATPTAAPASVPAPAPVPAPAAAAPMPGIVAGTAAAPAEPTWASYTAETREIDRPTQTVAGQMDSLLAQDSPLMQRARTIANQQMAQRGLVNSSMAVGASQAAMIDRALPIAQQDANTYNALASENMAARNQAGMFNAGEQNKFGLQTAQQNFVSAQAALDRAQQVFLQDRNFDNQMTLQQAQQAFAGAQADLDRAQQVRLQDDAQSFQTQLTKMQQSFAAAQADLDRQQQAYLQDDMQAFQESMAATQIPANFAMQINESTMSAINAIAQDPNLSGKVDGKEPAGSSPKSRAIQSAINYANSQITWANKFYSTNIPQFSI